MLNIIVDLNDNLWDASYLARKNVYIIYIWDSEGTFSIEVSNRETIVTIDENNGTYCLQKRIEKFQLHRIKENLKTTTYSDVMPKQIFKKK